MPPFSILIFLLNGGNQQRRLIHINWFWFCHVPEVLSVVVIAGLCCRVTRGSAEPNSPLWLLFLHLGFHGLMLGASSQCSIPSCWAVFSQLYEVISSDKTNPIKITTWQLSFHASLTWWVTWGKLTSGPQNFAKLFCYISASLRDNSRVDRSATAWKREEMVCPSCPPSYLWGVIYFLLTKPKSWRRKIDTYFCLPHFPPLYLSLFPSFLKRRERYILLFKSYHCQTFYRVTASVF